MAKILINDIKYHIQQLNPKGEKTIILITGLLGNVAQWYFTFAPILAKKYRVIMFDLRSHGKTEKTKDGFDLESMADDILALMNKLDIEQTHLVGYSYGSQIAIKFAIKYPDKIDCLVLLESPSPKHSMVYQIMNEYNLTTLEEVKRKLPEIVIGKVQSQITPNEKSSRSSQRVFKSIMKVFKHLCWDTTLIEDLHREQEFENDDLQAINANTLLLYGSESDCLDEAKKLDTWIPNTQYILKNGGHWYPLEQPTEVGKDIRNFLQLSEVYI